MSKLSRLSFTIEDSLLKEMERLVKQRRYANRSEFIRDMIRAELVEQEWSAGEEALGTITLIYNHHFHHLNEKLTELQHEHFGTVMATTHIHLDKHLCAEMIMLRGNANQIRQLADLMRQQKGVLHAALSMSSTGKNLI